MYRDVNEVEMPNRLARSLSRKFNFKRMKVIKNWFIGVSFAGLLRSLATSLPPQYLRLFTDGPRKVKNDSSTLYEINPV